MKKIVIAGAGSYHFAPAIFEDLFIRRRQPVEVWMVDSDLDMAELSAFAEGIAAKLKGLDALPEQPVAVKGEDPIRPYYTPRDRHGNPVNILKVKPLTDAEKCVKCGLCAALCPMGSIDKEDPAKIEGICIKCCACEKKCPTGAKYYTDAGYLYHQHELEEGFARRAEPECFL